MNRLMFTLSLLISVTSRADEPVRFKAVFDQVISQKCILCHSNPAKKPFDMTTYAEVMTVVVPGNLDESKLYQAIIKGEMPPQKIIAADPSYELTQEDASLIEQWISQGAME